jgi:hypothetical protein
LHQDEVRITDPLRSLDVAKRRGCICLFGHI